MICASPVRDFTFVTLAVTVAGLPEGRSTSEKTKAFCSQDVSLSFAQAVMSFSSQVPAWFHSLPAPPPPPAAGRSTGSGGLSADTEEALLPTRGATRQPETRPAGGRGEANAEPWELPPSPRAEGSPPSEAEKALLRIVKKLREVKAINARIQAGEPVDSNQRAKAARREELIMEWASLHEDVARERKCSRGGRGLVSAESGAPSSRLRSEAASRVGTRDAAADASRGTGGGEGQRSCSGAVMPSSLLAELAWAESSAAAIAVPPVSSRRRRRGKGGGSEAKDDGGGWTVVVSQKAKKQQVSEEEKEARWEAHVARQAMRVQSTESEVYRLTSESLKNIPLFTPADCEHIEELIEQVTIDAQRGLFKEHSVDLTPFRNKYFFGFAYTYGAQRDYPGARGVEAVWPPEDTSEIPAWIREMVIQKLEAKRVVPKGWINSATINDYCPGGFIVSHIDPPHLFDRPIISISFFSDCNLVFGARFGHPDEGPGEATVPALVHRCLRGNATVLKGYSADKITHGIRSCDLLGRRASIILRRVLPSAPVLKDGRVVPLEEHLKSRRPFG
mmetsp:Transcript_77032/g.212877  ORF Transcript_77032/g.212877 Transcript_77032/m.212877 type:complete len:562 (-) Transcript_77032:123-1808(-)